MEIHDLAVRLENTPARFTRTKETLSKRKTLKAGEVILFARTLGELLEGGVPILKALEGLESVAPSSEFRVMIAYLKENIQQGESFSAALEQSGKMPVFFYQMVYGGEVSGQVPVVLSEIVRYMEKEQVLKRSIVEALIYPVFIVSVGLVTLGVLTSFVLPRLGAVYQTFGTELPWITRFILASGKAFLPLTVATSCAAGFLFVQHKERLPWHRIPFAGDLAQKFRRIRFSRLLALLLDSGVPVLQALEVMEKTFGDSAMSADITFIKTSLSTGHRFSDCLDGIPWMDPVSRMLVVSGEETGRLSASFLQVSRDTAAEMEARLLIAVKLLEPTLVLLIGASVGLVVVATVLPIFDMSSIVR